MTEPVRIEIYAEPCPILDHSNPDYLDVWRQLGPADRRQFVDGLVARSIFPIGGVDLESSVPPIFEYPPWHSCVTSGRLEQAGGGAPYQVRDEGERARAFQAGTVGADGFSPLPGTGLISARLLDWLKWAALAAVVVGVVYLIRKRGKK